MKLGPLDLNQPSTWRGLLGFASVIGFTLKPELRDQIALALAAALSAIELFRDEYRARNARDLTPTATATTTGPHRPAPGPMAGAPVQRLRVPAIADTPDLDPPESRSGFGDR